MTIKKAQGQTLDKCGLLLNSHVISHGQLYVALNRVRKGEDLSICCEAQLGMAQMRNVVCSKLFPNPALAQ
ncbi:hypothetical protein L596_013902 [Steinernema carpocapsae]|uniref:Uncharacterized protein n=1 Tax=Steinernema carpocapsae TaxID=34508 RepID=A0A4U5P2N7_STECR|nr:hypothetical protein L596_013902 [Steinernema carpocapsae]